MIQFTKEQLDKRLEGVDFEMFTNEGNEECRKGVKKIFDYIRGEKRVTKCEVQDKKKEIICEIEKKHGEVWDTEPYYIIRDLTRLCCKEVGYNFVIQ